METRWEMNKKKAITKFIIICVLIVVGFLACFANFRLPFSSQKYVGFMGAIEKKMGIDLKGGVLAVFDTTANGEGDYSDQIDATVLRLEKTLTSRGFVEATVVRQGDKIRIEIPELQDTEELTRAIGEPAQIDMRTSSGTVFLSGKQIKGVEYYWDSQAYKHGVKLTFTDEGGSLFRQEVQNAGIGGTISIFVNDREISRPKIESLEAGKDNTTVITGDSYTKESAELFKTQIESGLFEVKLSLSETSVIAPTLGEGALTGGIIACIVGLVFIFILMYLIYGDLGLLSNLSLLVYMVLFLFALAVVGSVQLTLPGIAGIILSLGMAVDANVVIFETIKDEYKSGKRLPVAIESGFNRSFWTIFDANITTIIAAVVLYLLGAGAIKGFAITLFLGVVISMFCSLVITRSFAKLYLYINNNNAKRLRLKRNETDEAVQKATLQSKPRVRTLNR